VRAAIDLDRGRAHPLGGGALGARLMAWSLLATMNQLGTFFQPGSTASGSPNAMSAAGCWLAARAAEAAQRSGSRLVCRAVPGAINRKRD
jgi:hypothetical protein